MGTVNTKDGRRVAVAERPQVAARLAEPAPKLAAAPPRPPASAAETTQDTDQFRPRTQNWEVASKRGAMAKRREKGLGHARALGRRSPEMAAVVVASFLVSLSCLYVGAYARVTAESFEKERLEEKLQQARADEEALHAEVSRLQMPDSIRFRAKMLGLVPSETPALNLVTPPTPAATADIPKETP